MHKIKNLARKHWNIIPWLVVGICNLIDGNISRWDYGCALLAILIMVWMYIPVSKMGVDIQNED